MQKVVSIHKRIKVRSEIVFLGVERTSWLKLSSINARKEKKYVILILCRVIQKKKNASFASFDYLILIMDDMCVHA